MSEVRDTSAVWHDNWGNIDQTDDPRWYIHMLDITRTRKRRSVSQDPQRMFSGLHVREGQRILEVGCGIGDDVQALIQLVGPTGQVAGMDFSEQMVREARKRSPSMDLLLQFFVGDAHSLPLPDALFDGCLSSTVFQHLADPPLALEEMIRVLRPGGHLLLVEPDWETLAVDADPPEITRAIVDHLCESIRNARIGRQLPGLFKRYALEAVEVVPEVYLGSYLEQGLWLLGGAARHAREVGLISLEEEAAWIGDLKQRAQRGVFMSAVTVFCVSGRKASG